jgi:hydrogenase nickel incorporation protein HypA/HybF
MHEESLTRALLSQVVDLARVHYAVAVRQIEVSCGPLSGVDPVLLQSAFQRIQTEYSGCEQAELTIVDPGLPAQCRQCQNTFQVVNFRFLCPLCGSGQVQVLDGDCLKLLNLQLQTSESTGDSTAAQTPPTLEF